MFKVEAFSSENITWLKLILIKSLPLPTKPQLKKKSDMKITLQGTFTIILNYLHLNESTASCFKK